MQGYTYAALLTRADLADAFGDDKTARTCRAKAQTLRTEFARAFWVPDQGWYAIALDGAKRQVDALSSNVGHCLWTGIATDEHATVLVKALGTPAMDTGYGLRTLVRGHGCLQPDELSQRVGVAARHRDHDRRADPLLAHPGRGGPRPPSGQGRVRRRPATFDNRLPELFCGFAARPTSARRSPTPPRARRRHGRAARRCSSSAHSSACSRTNRTRPCGYAPSCHPHGARSPCTGCGWASARRPSAPAVTTSWWTVSMTRGRSRSNPTSMFDSAGQRVITGLRAATGEPTWRSAGISPARTNLQRGTNAGTSGRVPPTGSAASIWQNLGQGHGSLPRSRSIAGSVSDRSRRC